MDTTLYRLRYFLAVVFILGVCGPISLLLTSSPSATPSPAHSLSCDIARQVFGDTFSYTEDVDGGQDSVGDPADLGCTLTDQHIAVDVRTFRAATRLDPSVAYKQRLDPMADNNLASTCLSRPVATYVGGSNGYTATSCNAVPWPGDDHGSFAVLTTNNNRVYVRVQADGHGKVAGAALYDAIKLATRAAA